MKKSSSDKGFILAFVVAFMAVVIILLTLIVLSSSHPVKLCNAKNREYSQMIALEAIGKDFADDGRVDGKYDNYAVEFICDERLTVKNPDNDKILLTIELMGLGSNKLEVLL